MFVDYESHSVAYAERRLQEYSISKEIVTAKMISYKNMKAIVRTLDGAILLEISGRVLQVETLAWYFFLPGQRTLNIY